MDFEDLKMLFQLFNRKERYHLVHYASNGFKPSSELCRDLKQALGIEIDRESAWMAMDYHLDWLSAILALFENEVAKEFLECGAIKSGEFKNRWKSEDRAGDVIEGNQQDMDLVLLAQRKNASDIHLIMVEAKLDSGWTSKQLGTKGKRLKQLFPESTIRFEKDDFFIHCHLVMVDPRKKTVSEAASKALPAWAGRGENGIPRICLPVARTDTLLKPVRTGAERKGGPYRRWEVQLVRFT